MRRVMLLVIFLISAFLIGADSPRSIYDFDLNRIDGTPAPLKDYAGKVLMIVNVASKCGNTPQYAGLEALYAKYRDQGFVVLGFPANDFGGQEPGSNAEIADYCRAVWGVDFPVFEKISVKGDTKHPLYAFITSRPAPIGGEISWNFQKFLVDRDGTIVERFSPGTQPMAPAVIAKIEAMLED